MFRDRNRKTLGIACILGFLVALPSALLLRGGSKPQEKQAAAAPGPMLDDGFIRLQTREFDLSLVRSSQTVASLKPRGIQNFDFTPGDLLAERSQNGYFHLGDITLRLRLTGASDWKNYSTSTSRMPVKPLAQSGGVLAAADLKPTLPADFPLDLQRTWAVENGKLILTFTLKNTSQTPIEIGALGIPMIFDNDLNNRTLEQAHALGSFYDPYIGEDAGYLQVTRLNGAGPALLVLPHGKTPFEAYNPILDKPGTWGAKPVFTDPTPRGITFEGFYEWMVHSKAYAENEWKNAQPWNAPTGLVLAPGQIKVYGLEFVLSDSIPNIENTLIKNDRPVAVGIPGYVLPSNQHARLFLKYSHGVKSVEVNPAGAIAVRAEGTSRAGAWMAYGLDGKTWGRSRLTVTYSDRTVQTIQYFVTKPEEQVAADLGHFLTTRQWDTDQGDPFHRSPSVMTFDREANQIVTQDSRAWIAGLGDEGGAGSWLAAIMKQWVDPNAEEIQKFEDFVDNVLWGRLQYKDGPNPFGVRKSLFYYQPDEFPGYYRSDFDWTTWTSWNKKASEAVDRSYDYPHVAAAYWVLYHLARNNSKVTTRHPWNWYLNQAYETSIAMTKYAPELSKFGQMEGDIFVQILTDLKREGMNQQAANLESTMRARAALWKTLAYPFGSEMPWDSTGQEEVYAWTKYFGDQSKADVTLNAILGYDPAIPHWGYNGSARRYWDFIFAAKDRRLERQLHHYGSGLNAIPLLAEYREHPENFYLLRVGYGGTMGALTDIDQEGFGSVAFHGFPDMLAPDPYTGDYGPNYFGHAWNTATYIVDHPEFGWVAFGGNLEMRGQSIKVTPLDSARSRIYIAPYGLWLTLDAGKFESVELDSKTGEVRVQLSPADEFTSTARLLVDQPGKLKGVGNYAPVVTLRKERGAYVVPLGTTLTEVKLAR